jgi:hypothetical protein
VARTSVAGITAIDPIAPVDQSPWRVDNRARACAVAAQSRGRHLGLVLRPTTSGGTRLVSRIRITHTSPSGLAFARVLELADLPIYRRMLLGFKELAEALATKVA